MASKARQFREHWADELDGAAMVGAGISLLTGRPLLQSGARQLLVGGLAAAATFGIGRLIGVSVS